MSVDSCIKGISRLTDDILDDEDDDEEEDELDSDEKLFAV